MLSALFDGGWSFTLYLSTGTLSQNGVAILLKWGRSSTAKPQNL